MEQLVKNKYNLDDQHHFVETIISDLKKYKREIDSPVHLICNPGVNIVSLNFALNYYRRNGKEVKWNHATIDDLQSILSKIPNIKKSNFKEKFEKKVKLINDFMNDIEENGTQEWESKSMKYFYYLYEYGEAEYEAYKERKKLHSSEEHFYDLDMIREFNGFLFSGCFGDIEYVLGSLRYQLNSYNKKEHFKAEDTIEEFFKLIEIDRKQYNPDVELIDGFNLNISMEKLEKIYDSFSAYLKAHKNPEKFTCSKKMFVSYFLGNKTHGKIQVGLSATIIYKLCRFLNDEYNLKLKEIPALMEHFIDESGILYSEKACNRSTDNDFNNWLRELKMYQ